MKYLSRLLRLLVCWMVAGVCLPGTRVQAQDGPKAPAAQDTANLPISQDNTFAKLMTQLQPKLTERDVDPQNHAFHFVVLMNTQAIEGPVATWMETIYHGLLQHYLTPGDRVSFVPFQNHVRAGYGATNNTKNNWNQVYDPNNAAVLMGLMPTARDTSDTEKAGHNPEGALQTALEQAQSGTYPIYILLSNDRFAQTPDGENVTPTANTPEFQQALDAAHQEIALENTYPETSADIGKTAKGEKLYYRVYLPKKGTLAAPALTPSRDEQIKQQVEKFHWTDMPSLPTQALPPPIIPVVHDKNSTPPPKPHEPPIDPDPLPEWVPYVVIALLAAGLGAGLLLPRLSAKYDVQVDHLSKSVSMRRSLQIGGPVAAKPAGTTKGDAVAELSQFPANAKVARVQAGFNGQVSMEGLPPYTLSTERGNKTVTLSSAPAVVIVTDSRDNNKVGSMKVQRVANKATKK